MTPPSPTPSPGQKQPVTGWQRTVVIGMDRLIYRFSRRWLAFFNLIVAIYVGLPLLAPVLMNAGLTGPAKGIYFVYGPMCHQMASRSFFLFGEQPAYPRALAGTNYNSIESYLTVVPELADVNPDNWVEFQFAMRDFLGNDQLGYKMALCERDMAIYGFVLIAGLVYGLVRKRRDIKAIPWWLFLIVGMGPIGLDGFSQLFGYMATPINGGDPTGFAATLQSIFALRESTPFLRSFTGALFGFMLAWLAYPHVDVGMKGTAQELERKLRRIGELPE